MSTPFHSRYFTYEFTKQGAKDVERLSRSLLDACVVLNSHQVNTALFADTMKGWMKDSEAAGLLAGEVRNDHI